jgi:hypothetical protein
MLIDLLLFDRFLIYEHPCEPVGQSPDWLDRTWNRIRLLWTRHLQWIIESEISMIAKGHHWVQVVARLFRVWGRPVHLFFDFLEFSH